MLAETRSGTSADHAAGTPTRSGGVWTSEARRRFSGNLAVLAASAMLLGCSAADSNSTSSNGTEDPGSLPAESTVPQPQSSAIDPTSTTTTLPTPPDPGEELRAFVAVQGFGYSSGVIESDCGDFAVVGEGEPLSLLHWSGEEWFPNESVGTLTATFDNPVEEVMFADLTRDGNEEIIIRLDPQGGMRSFGFVLSVDQASCAWDWLRLVDSCGDWRVYDSLSLSSTGRLTGSGFPGGCSGRTGVSFEWIPSVERLVARVPGGGSTCEGSYVEGEFDLPLMTCDSNWAVQMAQQVLSAAGLDVDVDGYFGPGTQLATLAYQQRNELYMSGVLDGDTWSHMFPIDPDLGYIDYDGDGVASPVEIGHYSGANLLYQDDGYSEPVERAIKPSEPYVVAVECEARPTGVVSSWTGPHYIYKRYHVMSDGSRQLVGTNWSNGGTVGRIGC